MISMVDIVGIFLVFAFPKFYFSNNLHVIKFNFSIIHFISIVIEQTIFKIVTGTPAGKRPLGMPRRRWEGNIRMDLREIGMNTRNWVDSAQDRDCWRAIENAALNHRIP